MSRAPRVARVVGALAVSLATVACGARSSSVESAASAQPSGSAGAMGAAPSVSSSSASKRERSSPEGVVLEIATPVPAPSEVAPSADVVVLGEPIPDEAIRELVFSFFDAIRRRDLESLTSLVAESGVTLEGLGTTYGNRDALLTMLRLALRDARDYGKLSPAEIATSDRIERFSISDLAALGKKKPEPMRPLDVLVRIAMPAVRGTGEKLFDDYVVLVVRAEAGKLKIVTKTEEPSTSR